RLGVWMVRLQDIAAGARMPLPSSFRLTGPIRCGVTPLQARHPCGPLRSLSRSLVAYPADLEHAQPSSPGREGCARRNGAGAKTESRRPGLWQAGEKGDIAMDECVMCTRTVDVAENWIKCHLWGGFAIFHWRCFGEYLRAESEERVESVVWSASSLTKTS